MVGVSRTMRGDDLISYELVMIRQTEDSLIYEAHPAGQPSAQFRSRMVTESSILFENPKHDFPQQIGYQLTGDSLLAWIAGTQNGKPRRVEFPYRRAACAGAVLLARPSQTQVGTSRERLNPRIAAADRQQYNSIRDAKDWLNPMLESSSGGGSSQGAGN